VSGGVVNLVEVEKNLGAFVLPFVRGGLLLGKRKKKERGCKSSPYTRRGVVSGFSQRGRTIPRGRGPYSDREKRKKLAPAGGEERTISVRKAAHGKRQKTGGRSSALHAGVQEERFGGGSWGA